jgi:hypothetical protein
VSFLGIRTKLGTYSYYQTFEYEWSSYFFFCKATEENTAPCCPCSELNASSPAELKDAVLSISRAFSTFSYWPYNTQMVLGVAKKRPEIFTEAEIKEIDSYADRAEATWGKLTYYREGFSDFKNYQEHAQVIAPTPGLYAFDDTLVPASYSPSALRSDLKPKAA